MGGNCSFNENRQECSRDTCFWAYACRWRSLSRSCSGLFSYISDFDIQSVFHAAQLEYVSRMSEMLRTNISSGNVWKRRNEFVTILFALYVQFVLADSRDNDMSTDLALEVRQCVEGLLVV